MIWQNLPKTCMEMKKNWTEGGRPKIYYVDPPLQTDCNFWTTALPNEKIYCLFLLARIGVWVHMLHAITFGGLQLSSLLFTPSPSRHGSVNIILIPGFPIMLWSTLRNHPPGEGSADPLALDTMLQFVWARCSEVSSGPFYGSETSSRVHPVQPMHHHHRSMSHYITTITKVLQVPSYMPFLSFNVVWYLVCDNDNLWLQNTSVVNWYVVM